jgi:hypothetical protein
MPVSFSSGIKALAVSSGCPAPLPVSLGLFRVWGHASLKKVARCRIADRRGKRVSFRQWMRLNIVAVCATNCGDRFDLCLSFRRYCYLLRRLRWC